MAVVGLTLLVLVGCEQQETGGSPEVRAAIARMESESEAKEAVKKAELAAQAEVKAEIERSKRTMINEELAKWQIVVNSEQSSDAEKCGESQLIAQIYLQIQDAANYDTWAKDSHNWCTIPSYMNYQLKQQRAAHRQ